MTDHRHGALRSRLLLIALGTSGACDRGAAPAPTPPPQPTPSLATPTPPPIPKQPATPWGDAGTITRTECFAPHSDLRARGPGEPDTLGIALPPQFDANGCSPKDQVADGCCNSPVEGPHFANNQCCYGWGRGGGCCGRPFLVEGHARTADVVRTDAWLARDITLRGGAIDPHTRRALADAWLADARMEHASIAAFARFVLQLVSLGAPASLVRDAAAAAVDEQRHAELCFSIASELAGTSLGAAGLAVNDALSSWSLHDVIAEVVVEGCIGETVAALVALRQLEGTTEPTVRRVLEQIAADEARHAELAWRFLRWAIDVGGAAAHEAARSAFAAAASSSSVCADGVDPIAWRSFGRLSAEERYAVERSAHEHVIGPCAQALFARQNVRAPGTPMLTI